MQELMKRLSSKWQSLIDIFDTTWELKLCKSTWTILCSQRSAFLLHSKWANVDYSACQFQGSHPKKNSICIVIQSCQLPQKNSIPSAQLSNPAQHPKQKSIPVAFFIQSCLKTQEKCHSTGIVIQSWQHPKDNSILPAFFVQFCVTLHENIPFHLPCNLVLLYMYTPRKISFHLHCNLILLYPPWKFPFLLDWYLIRSPFHLHCYPLLQQGFISSVIQWCSALVSLQKANERLVTDSLWCISKVEYISLAQGFP